jgi:hypothetical protein
MDRVDGLGNLVTREESTVVDYRGRVDRLLRRAGEAQDRPATLLEAIHHLGEQHDEYQSASIRKYYAALALAVDEALATGTIPPTQEAAHRDALADRPRLRPKAAEPRTSAKKRKDVSRTEVKTVCSYLWKRGKADDKLLVRLITHGVFLGLRPSEYSDADRQGDLLVVRTRKATNGRGLSAFRELDLADISPAEVASLDRLIANFARASSGDLERLIDRLGARLRRACCNVRLKPFALYTTRHQAIANLKAAGKSAAEIAAVAGHKSLYTASKAYAGSRSGWKAVPTAKATTAMLAKFEVRPTPPRPLSPKI